MSTQKLAENFKDWARLYYNSGLDYRNSLSDFQPFWAQFILPLNLLKIEEVFINKYGDHIMALSDYPDSDIWTNLGCVKLEIFTDLEEFNQQIQATEATLINVEQLVTQIKFYFSNQLNQTQ